MSKETYIEQVVDAESGEAERGGAMLASEFFNRQALEKIADWRIEKRVYLPQPELENEIWDNSRTALFEALTASGHLSEIDFAGPVEVVNQHVLRRLLNAFDDDLPEWEKDRRRDEIIEELIIHMTFEAITEGRLPADTMVVTVSDFPDGVDGRQAAALGYRSLNHKGMCRATFFHQDESGQWHRSLEQVSRSNSLNESSPKVISQLTGQYSRWLQAPNQTLASQMLVTRSVLPEGVVTLQAMLDEESGPNTRYGNTLHAHHQYPEYTHLRFISKEREAVMERYVSRLTEVEERLNAQMDIGAISYVEKQYYYEQAIDSMLNEICLLSPDYAAAARGEAAAPLFERAALAMAAGDDRLSQYWLTEALQAVDPEAWKICGGGGRQPEGAADIPGTVESIYKSALEAKSTWKWKHGVCVVPKCRKAAKVGPCGVCQNCQVVYDRGGDPTK